MKKLKLLESGWIYKISSEWTVFEMSDDDYNKITSWLYIVKKIEDKFTFENNIEAQELKVLEELNVIRKKKSEDIEKILTVSDQLNLIAEVLNTMTEPEPNLEIIANAKSKFAEIKTILNN